eukprot:5079818-Alexandrium_andersonii.AAC.1
MSASLVGSEMCIRDRAWVTRAELGHLGEPLGGAPGARRRPAGASSPRAPVSYTHLTLPTICSV